MKKLLTFLTMALLFYGVGWAGEVEYKTLTFPEGNSKGVSSYATTWYATINGFRWDIVNFNNNNNGWSYIKTGNKNTASLGTITTNTTIDKAITKVVVTVDACTPTSINSTSLEIASNSAFSTNLQTVTVAASTGELTYNVPTPTVNQYYRLKFDCKKASSNGIITISKVQYYYSDGGSTVETVATPTFSPVEGTYTSAQNVEINCATSGATIYYTTNGNDPTTNSSVYSSAIPVSTTTTIKALAVMEGMNNSAIASATYTIFTPATVTPTYTEDFSDGFGDFYIENQTNPGFDVWTTGTYQGTTYAKAAAYKNSSNHASASMLISPYINLANTTNPEFSFSQAIDSHFGTIANEATVWVKESNASTWTQITIDYPDKPSSGYTSFESQTISLSAYKDKTIQIAFKYVSTTSNAGNWEVTNFKVEDIGAYNIYRTIKTNGNSDNEAGGWIGDWSSNCSTPDGVSGNHYTVTAIAGETVQFKAGTNSGYQILDANISAVDGNNNPINLTKVANLSDNTGSTFTFTMPASEVTITANFTTYHPTLRIAGSANGRTSFVSSPVESLPTFTYNSTSDEYTIDVYFTGEENNDHVDYFYFKVDNDDLKPSANGNFWITNVSGGEISFNSGGSNFRIEPGVYTIKVNGDRNKLYVTKKTPTITLSPAAGEVEQGTTVNATSTLTSMIAAIKDIDSGAQGSVTVGVNTDNGNTWNENVTLNTVGSAIVYGKAFIGNIDVTGNATYTVYAAYAITCSATPEGYGTVTADKQTAREGETVTLTVTPSNNNYEVTSVTVNGTTLEPNDGVYSFEMPASAVEVIATFNKIQYTITKAETNCTINITDNLTTAGAGDPVSFTVTPRGSKYVISSVTISWEGGNTQTLTAVEGVYSFTMQGRNVTINAVCEREAVGDGTFVLVPDASQLKAGDKVIITSKYTPGDAYAMSKTQNASNRSATSITITDDVKVTPGNDVQIFTLEGDSQGWYFNTGNGYIYASSSSANELKTESDKDDNAKALISISTSNYTIYEATIEFQGDNERNSLRYNPNSSNNNPLFSCYRSTSGMSHPFIFKQSAAGLMVEINPEGGDVIGAQEVTIDANIEGAMVQYKIGDGEWSTAAEAPVTTTITGNVGDDVVVYAKASLVDDDETLEDDISATYHFIAPNAPVITPSSKSVMDVKQSVTITSDYANGVIEYSIDGGDWTTYNGVFDVFINALGESATVTARVTVNGVTSETTSATYTRNIQPVVFSPVSGTYYYGEQSVEMFSVTPGARIYYTMTTDGTEPADPVMNGTGVQLYSGPIEGLEAGTTYKFKAVAYIGTTASEVSSAEYTIEAHSDSYWQNVAAMNADDGSVTKYFENPVQVVYMSTYQNNGRTPEFCYVRDNSGYGLVYFAKNHTAYNGYTKFQMGDWLDGKTIQGTTDTWDRGFHNELGTSSGSINQWPSNNVGNTTILPEAVTNADVKAGWNASNYNSSGGYKTGVTDDNLWGHYIHLRNNTVSGLSTVDDKYKGVMTDQNNEKLTYYDVFYKFSGFGTNAKTYNQSFFDARQVKGATFDFYGIVAFYGPDINNTTYANQPFQIVPLDILWVYAPQITGVESDHTYAEPKEVTLSIDAVDGDDEHSSVIWYKTSEMDDYAIYTGPFTVSSTTTIEAYTTKMTEYSDRMESNHVTMNVTFTEVNAPEISPASGVFATGDPAVNATISRDESDNLSPVTIWFTVDGSDPSVASNSNRYEYTAENIAQHLTGIKTTTTVRAIAEYDGVYSAEAEARTYTFVESNGIIYDLVTNVNQINEGGVYVIVSQAYHQAMSSVQNATNRGATGVKFVDEDTKTQVYGNQDVAVFTVTTLTHEGDQSGEKHFLFTTNNGATMAANGILYVDETAADNGNTLLTEAEEDAMGNSVAVVTIDSDEGEQSHKAHIRFNYAGGDNRYLQYWNRDHYFTTYKTEDPERAVYIYGVQATPLATIEKEGVKNTPYTVADRLLVVAANVAEHVVWAKDEGNVSIEKTEIKKVKDVDQIDYMRFVAEHDINNKEGATVKFQNGEWDQSNWVMIKLHSSKDPYYSQATHYKGMFIKAATLQGTYTDDVNYTIEAADGLNCEEGEEYTPNVFCAANFLDANLNLTESSTGAREIDRYDDNGEPIYGDRYFFLMNPKVQEVATITYAVWDGTKFVMPAKDGETINGAGLSGAFTVDLKYNTGVSSTTSLEPNQAYQFLGVLNKVAQQGNAPRRAESTVEPGAFSADAGKVVYPLDLTASGIVTEVRDLTGNAVREVASVKYVSITGVVSDKPFEGMNIIVTRYTDGTTSTAKVMR